MAENNGKKNNLWDTSELLKGVQTADSSEFSVDDILAEFGKGEALESGKAAEKSLLDLKRETIEMFAGEKPQQIGNISSDVEKTDKASKAEEKIAEVVPQNIEKNADAARSMPADLSNIGERTRRASEKNKKRRGLFSRRRDEEFDEADASFERDEERANALFGEDFIKYFQEEEKKKGSVPKRISDEREIVTKVTQNNPKQKKGPDDVQEVKLSPEERDVDRIIEQVKEGTAGETSQPVSEDAGSKMKLDELFPKEDRESGNGKKRGLFHRRAKQDEPEYEDQEDDDFEEPKPLIALVEEEESIPAADSAKEIIARIGRRRLRFAVSILLMIPLCYIMFAPKLGLPLPESLEYFRKPYTFLFICVALQVFIMLLNVDVLVSGIYDIIKLHPNMESVVAFSSVVSLLHAVSIIAFPTWEGYYPYTIVTSASLFCASLFNHMYDTGRIRSYRTVAGISKPYVVTLEDGIYNGSDALVKTKSGNADYFVNQTEQLDITRRLWRFAAPLFIVACILFAVMSSVGRGEPQRFLWCLSAVSAVASPLTLCLPFYMPFNKAAKRLGSLGEAITGWSAAIRMAVSDNLVITDGDLFPPGSVAINGLKIFGGYTAEKIVIYTASIVARSNSALTRPFGELLKNQGLTERNVLNFKFFENGGIGGEVGGDNVLVGTAAFMMRTGIKVPHEINSPNAVFVAVNLELAGIFAMKYNTTNSVKNALNMLVYHRITPVFATRDFNINPAMIETKFKVTADSIDFPPIEDRLALSSEDREFSRRPVAVISRDGLSHVAECVVCARNLGRAVRICTMLTLISVIVGVMLMFYLVYSHSPVAASPTNLLVYMLLWVIPHVIAANWVNS